jgi:hypothetical protein
MIVDLLLIYPRYSEGIRVCKSACLLSWVWVDADAGDNKAIANGYATIEHNRCDQCRRRQSSQPITLPIHAGNHESDISGASLEKEFVHVD